MIYPLSNVRFEIQFERGTDGGLRACGVAITDHEGWIEVPMPERAVAAGAPSVVALRVRSQRGEGGRIFIDADRFVVRGRPYGTLAELLDAGAGPWLPEVGAAFDDEVERRIRESPRVRSGYHRKSTQSTIDAAGHGEVEEPSDATGTGPWRAGQ